MTTGDSRTYRYAPATTADAQRMRDAGRDLLSLALIDSRNATLRWFAAIEEALVDSGREAPGPRPGLPRPLWVLGHVGWFQERWIVRNLQRALGRGCDATLPRLASIEPRADAWYDPAAGGAGTVLPDAAATRQYLMATLETTLDLLAHAVEDDEGLFFFRAALFHEDARCELLAAYAQAHGLGGAPIRAMAPPRVAYAPREPVAFAPTRVTLGCTGPGFACDVERPAMSVSVPSFEIDAAPVTWGQFSEFVDDGGYDDPAWWSPAGRRWREQLARRAPRHVEQLRGGVLARQFGTLARMPAAHPAQHVSWYEAQAWCRWAGRRLPTEAEWEVAAQQARARGFVWGEVWEWTADEFEPYPGYAPDPWRSASSDPFRGRVAVRGASRWTSPRWVHPKVRRGLAPARDDAFVGFRSCAL